MKLMVPLVETLVSGIPFAVSRRFASATPLGSSCVTRIMLDPPVSFRLIVPLPPVSVLPEAFRQILAELDASAEISAPEIPWIVLSTMVASILPLPEASSSTPSSLR